jgi:hypothetical protein
MTTHPILGPIASVHALGVATLEAIKTHSGCSIPTMLAEINARGREFDADHRAVGSLCAQDPQCYEGPIPCPHHVERVDDGGPAFPTFSAISHCDEGGMTLRDYFAAKVMQGICARNAEPCIWPESGAKKSYEIADALLRARSTATGDSHDRP